MTWYFKWLLFLPVDSSLFQNISIAYSSTIKLFSFCRVYDGAFSEHITSSEKRGLTGDEIDEQTAKQKAEDFIGKEKIQNPVLWSYTERKKRSRRSQIKRTFLSQWFWCKQLSGLRKLTLCGDEQWFQWGPCGGYGSVPNQRAETLLFIQSINHLNDKKVRMKLSRNNWIYEISFEKMDSRGSKLFNFKALLQLISCLRHISQTSVCFNIKVRTSSYWIKIFLSMHYGNLIILI